MPQSWYVMDMDEGCLRIERTRRAAVRWWLDFQCANKVLNRHTYCPGYYSYTVGYNDLDSIETAIVREDCLKVYGYDGNPKDIEPMYPHNTLIDFGDN